MFIYLSGFDLSSYQQKQNMKHINNLNAKYIFLGTYFGFIFLDGVIANSYSVCLLGEAVDELRRTKNILKKKKI